MFVVPNFCLTAFVSAVLLLVSSPTGADSAVGDEVNWLKQRSMLLDAERLRRDWEGSGKQWRHPYGVARPKDFLKASSAWLAIYPSAVIGRPDTVLLETLGDPDLLAALGDLGLDTIHTGPLKRAGGVRGRTYTPSIDGHFDRIELRIDPLYGSDALYRQMAAQARAKGISIVGDIVPGHTGKGPDFRLAERNVADFPGLYTMVEIPEKDWAVLPGVPDGEDSVNLSVEMVKDLKQRGHLIGPLDAVVFARPGIKQTSWSATDVVNGVDGTPRRWVYLHIFKRGQPSLNWLDPSFGAHELIAGDIMHSLGELGASAFRLDATMFLGVGPRPGIEKGWLINHPLSVHATTTIAMLIRKLGGYSFQEFNAPLDQIARSLRSGSELAYDFTSRPAYLYALVTGDAGLLRLMYREMLASDVRPMRLVHGMQNHDELMLEASHLKDNGDASFVYEGKQFAGATLYNRIHEEVIAKTTGERGAYNEAFAMSPGVCATLASLIAASMGVEDPNTLTPEQLAEVRTRHLAAAAFNAMQPGAFVVSGWDLVGAMPVAREQVRDRLKDKDCRWLNRGAYDLMDFDADATMSQAGLPRATSLYGTVPNQLKKEDSFVSRLRDMLAVRRSHNIATARAVAVPEVTSDGVFIMVNRLEDGEERESDAEFQITAINFTGASVQESMAVNDVAFTDARTVFSTIDGKTEERLDAGKGAVGGAIDIDLRSYEAKIMIASQS